MTTLFAASCCFGVMAVLVRLTARELDALEVAWVRFAGSFVLLVALSRGRGLRPRAGTVRRLVLRGLLGASSIVCYFAGIARAGAGLATLLHSTYPVFTALWGVVLLGQVLTGRVAGALALSALGATVVLHDQLGQGPAVLAGVGTITRPAASGPRPGQAEAPRAGSRAAPRWRAESGEPRRS